MLNSVVICMKLSYLSTTAVGPLFKHTLLLISYICGKYITWLLYESISKGIVVHMYAADRSTHFLV